MLAETAATKKAEANQARREAKREVALSAAGKARRRRRLRRNPHHIGHGATACPDADILRQIASSEIGSTCNRDPSLGCSHKRHTLFGTPLRDP